MKNKQAFTLIELLVVVLIIGILAAVALPQYQKAVEKSRATEALTIMRAYIQAQETYKMANGEYATDDDALDVQLPNPKYFTVQNMVPAGRIQVQRKGLFVWFVYYFSNQSLTCRVYKSAERNSKERELCKSFSKTIQTCGSADDSNCDCYVL